MGYFYKIIFFVILLATSNNCSNTSYNNFRNNPYTGKCSNNYNAGNYKGHYKVGKPYLIKNIKYYPHHNPSYSEIGVASWYGDSFHCKKTANGEVFNKYQLSAAHRTLPLPSIVKVTNLKNNKSIEVIVNDRGPFAHNRIIDLSDRAADVLDFKKQGVTKVKVEFLEEKTKDLLNQIKYSNLPKKNTVPADPKIELAANKTVNTKKTTPEPVNITSGSMPEEFSILVDKFANKTEAIKSVKNLSNMGTAKLVKDNNDNKFHVYFNGSTIKSNQKSNILKKIIAMGYQKAYLLG